MKFLNCLIVSALCATTFFSACQNDAPAATDAATETNAAEPAITSQSPVPLPGDNALPSPVPVPGVMPSPAPNPAATPPATEPAQNATGVWHYTCSKGCAGGSGTATACAKCGTTLVHNTSYHPPKPTPAATNTPAGAPGTTTPPKPEPAQNTAGVWHYTCSGGCAGGAGTAADCSKCGKKLTHNATYHQ